MIEDIMGLMEGAKDEHVRFMHQYNADGLTKAIYAIETLYPDVLKLEKGE
jgi:hypothetical protein